MGCQKKGKTRVLKGNRKKKEIFLLGKSIWRASKTVGALQGEKQQVVLGVTSNYESPSERSEGRRGGGCKRKGENA